MSNSITKVTRITSFMSVKVCDKCMHMCLGGGIVTFKHYLTQLSRMFMLDKRFQFIIAPF